LRVDAERNGKDGIGQRASHQQNLTAQQRERISLKDERIRPRGR
jgi:hypothetical protein